jgi:hypothetical protein
MQFLSTNKTKRVIIIRFYLAMVVGGFESYENLLFYSKHHNMNGAIQNMNHVRNKNSKLTKDSMRGA